MQALQSFLSLATLQSLIRAVFKVGGGYLLARGIADENAVEAITAGALALAAILWGVWQRSHKTPPPAGLPLALLAALAIALGPGCSSFNTRAFRAGKLRLVLAGGIEILRGTDFF